MPQAKAALFITSRNTAQVSGIRELVMYHLRTEHIDAAIL
jgi:hypothetical protein